MNFKNNNRNSAIGLRIAAALMLSAGLLWTAHNFVTWKKQRAHIRARSTVLHELRELESAQMNAHAAMTILERLPRPVRPPSLPDMVANNITAPSPMITERGKEPLADSWRLCRAELLFNDVALTEIAALLNKMQRNVPPWALRSCDIHASARQDGYGRVVLQLESLERD